MSVGSIAAATLVLSVPKECQWHKGRAGLSSAVGLRTPQADTSASGVSAEISSEFFVSSSGGGIGGRSGCWAPAPTDPPCPRHLHATRGAREPPRRPTGCARLIKWRRQGRCLQRLLPLLLGSWARSPPPLIPTTAPLSPLPPHHHHAGAARRSPSSRTRARPARGRAEAETVAEAASATCGARRAHVCHHARHRRR